MDSITIPPVLEEGLKTALRNAMGKSGNISSVTVDRLIMELKGMKIPVTDKTPRLVQYFLSKSQTQSQASNDENELEKSTATPMKKQKRDHRSSVDKSIEDRIMNNPTKSEIAMSARPTNRLSDLAGIDGVLKSIKELIFHPVYLNKVYTSIGVTPVCSVLFYGPSGCGKTSLANAIAGELDLPYFKVSGPDLISSLSGGSEQQIKQLFTQASSISSTFENDSLELPSLVFLDNLDVIAGKNEGSSGGRGMDKRILATLCDCIDGCLHPSPQVAATPKELPEGGDVPMTETPELSVPSKRRLVILIAATNKPENLDPGVRGRFATEIQLPIPDTAARTSILKRLTEHLKLGDVDFNDLGVKTVGYVGADLKALVDRSSVLAVERIIHESGGESSLIKKIYTFDDQRKVDTVRDLQLNDLLALLSSDRVIDLNNDICCITMNDMLSAVRVIVPTAKREGYATIPDVTFADVGALEDVRLQMYEKIISPIQQPHLYELFGLSDDSTGILLFGPPGCGKTLLAKAVASECGANFMSVKGPELLSSLVGESERGVREIFKRARANTPCVVFFDEIDSLVPKRGGMKGDTSGGNQVSDRVVAQFLTELDGMDGRKGVYVIGATNRLDMIDDAILRAKRMGTLIYVPLPSAAERIEILKALTNRSKVKFDVSLADVASDKRCEGFSGADLSNLVREASLIALRMYRANIDTSSTVVASLTLEHFQTAFQYVNCSVPQSERLRYDKVRAWLASGMHPLEAIAKSWK